MHKLFEHDYTTTVYGKCQTNLVTEGIDRIKKSEFSEALVLKPVEILMKEVNSRRVLSGVNSTSEIGHSGMQGANGSGVLRLTDNEDSNLSDERNPG